MTERASAALSKGTPAPDPLIGRVVGGRFKVTALIARGGMGKVYRAEQSPLGRICALKVLHPSHAGEQDPEFHKRFFLEASIASKLTHPNTVTIFDYGRTDDEIYYMAMEYLEGRTLHRAIRDAGQLPEERAAHIARQICRSLREAHALGVIHRDLKPANVFLARHGDEADFAKVLDFGLVKNVSDKGEDLTQTGMFMGSPKYMAPEQIRGDRVDARTDIYALGVILYEMLTGKVPFDRATSVNILMAHVHEEAPPMRQMNGIISVSGAMEQVVAGCMAKDPDRRFRSMDEVLVALKRVDGSAASASVVGPPSAANHSVLRLESGNEVRTDASPAVDRRARDASPNGTLREPSHASARRGSMGALVAGVALALATVVVVVYVVFRPKSSIAVPSPPTSVATAAGATLVTAPVTTAASPVAVPVKVRVSTDPDGAIVKEDGIERCSSTPCDILYKGADADPEREHKLTFTRQGYRVESRSVKATESAALGVKLTPIPRAAPPQPAPPRAIDIAAVPTGYKTDIPY
jgi:eukaryotic-like serine/threonine-protein kinase